MRPNPNTPPAAGTHADREALLNDPEWIRDRALTVIAEIDPHAELTDAEVSTRIRDLGSSNAAAVEASPVRHAYEARVAEIQEQIAAMDPSAPDAAWEPVARSASEARRTARREARIDTPEPYLGQILARDLLKYGDAAGPTYESLLEKNRQKDKKANKPEDPYPHRTIAMSATRTGGTDLGLNKGRDAAKPEIEVEPALTSSSPVAELAPETVRSLVTDWVQAQSNVARCDELCDRVQTELGSGMAVMRNSIDAPLKELHARRAEFKTTASALTSRLHADALQRGQRIIDSGSPVPPGIMVEGTDQSAAIEVVGLADQYRSAWGIGDGTDGLGPVPQPGTAQAAHHDIAEGAIASANEIRRSGPANLPDLDNGFGIDR